MTKPIKFLPLSVLLGLQLALTTACVEGDAAHGDERDDPHSHAAEPLDTLDSESLDPALAIELQSSEPIPAAIDLPAPEAPAFDARAAYHRWLDESETIALIVEVRALTPHERGTVAEVDILRTSRGSVDRSSFLLPHGMSCRGIPDAQVGETLLIHVAPSHLDDPEVVPISTVIAAPMLARVYQDAAQVDRVRMPWGDPPVDAMFAAIGGAL